MYKLTLFFLLSLISSGANAVQDSSLSTSKKDLTLIRLSNGKASRVTIGSKVIVKSSLKKYKGTLLSVGEESLTILQNSSEVEIRFDSVNVLIQHYGWGLRPTGLVIEVVSAVFIVGGVQIAGDADFKYGTSIVLVGLGGAGLAYLIKGKKYKMNKWQVVQNESHE